METTTKTQIEETSWKLLSYRLLKQVRDVQSSNLYRTLRELRDLSPKQRAWALVAFINLGIVFLAWHMPEIVITLPEELTQLIRRINQ